MIYFLSSSTALLFKNLFCRQSNEMPQNLDKHWQCQTCFQRFPSDNELHEHIEAFQSRARHLFAELQKCFAHSDPKLSDEEDCGASDDDDADNLVNDDCDGQEEFLCPHEECDGKTRTSFRTWKNFVRHYTIHVPCRETCTFCGLDIDRVRKYVTHIDNCKAKKEGQRGPEFLSKERDAIERRMILCKRASKELKLKRSMITNTSDEEVSSQEISSRKRAREMADANPENFQQSRKRRTEERDRSATVAISSDSSCEAPGTEDVAREIATPAHFGMPSNGSLIPTHHTARMSLPTHCDMDKSTTLSGNDGTFSARAADFLQYSVGSDETFMGDEYMGAFVRAPLLFSHTMDGSSSYPGQEYEATTHLRTPLLCSRTMDGSPSISAGHQYEATVLARAPLLASHTIDGSSSYPNVCHYEAPAQARILSVEYDTVDRRQSDTQLTNEEITALYETPQTVQILVPGAGVYG